MALIEVDRHRKKDLKHWRTFKKICSTRLHMSEYRDKIEEAKNIIREFSSSVSLFYVGCSWGKDSLTVTHLVNCEMQLDVPVVWVKLDPIFNPHCEIVRDNFVSDQLSEDLYDEIEVKCPHKNGYYDARTAYQKGFRTASRRHGAKYISGVRKEESSVRQLRSKRWGAITKNTCAPLNNWEAEEVFAYLIDNDLPIHPAYAMNMNGIYDTRRLRVTCLAITNGSEFGKRQWDMEYYPEEMKKLGTYNDEILFGHGK